MANERAVNSAICDGERAALQIFELQFSFARSGGVVSDVALQIGKTFLVGVAHNRHDQSAFRPDRDADVVEVVLDEIFVFDSAVDGRHGFQCFHGCFNEERHEPEFDAVLFCERLLRFGAQILHRAHVALVEGGQDRSGMLRHHELRAILRRNGDIFFRVKRA